MKSSIKTKLNKIVNDIIYHTIPKVKLISSLLKIAKLQTPHSFLKHKVVKNYGKQFNIKVLVETGTCGGGMVYSGRKRFKKIYSIELSKTLYNFVKKRFAKYDHIKLYQGDSGKVLPEILSNINITCVFWLDAHYSGGITVKGEFETPIMKELKVIFDHPFKNHVILIDDANLFVGKNDYPTMKELKKFVASRRPDLKLYVKYDIIRIHR